MSDFTSEQEVKRWKRQYYDHLDLLDQKEKEWQALEKILIKTVLRLSIAAEGQHSSIDRHLHDIRSEVKGQINVIRLGSVLDEISALVLKVGSKQGDDKKIITLLVRLLEHIDFPDAFNGQKKNLIKKLTRSTDQASSELADEVQNLLADSINQLATNEHGSPKTGLIRRLFGSSEADAGIGVDSDSMVQDIVRVLESLPWPSELEQRANKILKKLRTGSIQQRDVLIETLLSLVGEWEQESEISESSRVTAVSEADDVNLLEDVERDQTGMSGIALSRAKSPELTINDISLTADESEPSIQEILIRLLEQLMVTPDLLDEIDRLKQRIENKSTDANWKQLLRDVAQLINTLRNRMQEEKQEFESFLQQITGRLKEMDGFLAIENASLNEAEQASSTFDVVVSAQVQDIHDDMTMADDLDELKSKVERRLNVVSDHIKQYRSTEQERYANAQQNLEDMQSRLVMLEQESGDLRKLILEKNREAMFDALTGIPNRLSYEKKASEEIARCKRFSSPLCMAVWDIDKFKQVNDTYGHKVGDRVLKVIAQLLNERIRETDFIARYGGEEFVMFLPGTDEEEAFKLADALREKVAASKFKNQEEVIKITVSCGISSYAEGDTHESMFELADKALYAAKHNGRNQCFTTSSLPE